MLAISMMVAVTGTSLAGCGGSSATSSTGPAVRQSSSATGSSTTTAASTTTRARHHAHRRGRGAPPGSAPIGRTQRVHGGGSILSVTITHVFDPLTQTGAALPPGTQAAGVQLTIQVDQGATYDSTASGDVSVTASSGAAAPLFIKEGVCQTPLTDFESLIGLGETHSGCVGFAIARGAGIVAVRFSPHSRAPGSVTWR